MSRTDARSASGDSFDRWGPAALLAATACVVVARLWLAFHRLIDPDELEHLHAGYCVWRGMVPYRDLFEQHGPVLWYVSLPFFHWWGASLNVLIAGRVVIWILGAASVGLTWQLGNRLYGRWCGPVAALLLVLLPSFQEKNVEWRPDNVALPLVLLGIVAAERAVVARSVVCAALFGASLAGAFACTQKVAYVGVGLGAGFVAALVAESRRGSGESARTARGSAAASRAAVVLPLFAAAIGAALTLAAFAVFFAAQDALEPLLEMTIRLPLRWKTREPTGPYLMKTIIESPVFWGAGVAGLLLSAADMARANPRPPGVLIVLGGALVHAAGLLVVPAAFLQYYLPLWPLVAIFGARALLEPARLLTAPGDAPPARQLQFLAAVTGLVTMVAATALRWAYSPLPARWDAAFVAACAVAGVTAIVARRATIVAVFVAVALSAGPYAWIQFGPWSETMRVQQIQFERLLRATGPDDRFLDGFTGMSALRPHACFYFWINHHSWPMLPDEAKSAGLARAVADERTRVVLADVSLFKHLPPDARRLLAEQYDIDQRYSWMGCLVHVRRGRELPPPYDWPGAVEEEF